MCKDVYAACEVLEKNGVGFKKKPNEVRWLSQWLCCVLLLTARGVLCDANLPASGSHEGPRVCIESYWLLVGCGVTLVPTRMYVC